MNTKSISRIIGWLYVATVLAFLYVNLFVKGQLLAAGDPAATFQNLAGAAGIYRLAVSIDFLAMVAVMVLVFSLYAILKRVNPYLALVALGLRIAEVVMQAVAKVPDYLLLPLSRSFVSSGAASSADTALLGQMLLTASTQAVWLAFVFLAIGSLFNNWLFFKGKLIPASLAVYGLISTGLYAIGSCLALMVDLPESAVMGMLLPLVAFELLLGGYLAIFGEKELAA